MSNHITILLFLSLSLLTPAAHAADTAAVVKVFVTANPANFYQPWQTQGAKSVTGSGAILSGNRILTNAHVVSDQTFIQVKKNKDPKKYTAKLIAIQHECDLALLTVEDPDFFKGTSSLELGDLPKLQDTVTVMGFPTGGDKLSITEGVVSRIEVTTYTHSGSALLAVQIDAAINPGNSGGPVTMEGKLAGIAMQGNFTAQNIGFMIPVPVITHFFKDLEDGKIDGFPVKGMTLNSTENESMRVHYNIQDEEGGVLVTHVPPYSPFEGTLKVGDVVLSMDGTSIGSDGTFEFRGGERLSITHLISDKQIGGTVKIKVMRNGKLSTLTAVLKKYTPLVPPLRHFDKPPYYIFGGLIFTVLGTDFLAAWGDKWWADAPVNLKSYFYANPLSSKERHKEKVVLIGVLPDQINVGYHGIKYTVVTAVNGVEIKSFKQFAKLLHGNQSKEPRTLIQTGGNNFIVLNNKQIEKADAGILKRYRISARYSEDVAGWIENEVADKLDGDTLVPIR